MDTVIYLVKHCDIIPKGNFHIIENNDDYQKMSEKIVLSVQGEEKAMRLSKLDVLQNLDAIYSSNHAKTIGTAKYLASANHTVIQIDSRLNERKIGTMDGIEEKEFHRRQAKDWDFRLARGESLNDAKKRIVSAIKNILMFEAGNRVAVVSHSTIMTCLLSVWCEMGYNFAEDVILSYKGETLVDGHNNIPMVLEVTFDGMNVKNIRIVDFS